ncbi:tyrosine-type recombinase/integrase [Ornithinimicrobium panacihumi]|uniref:tyrosine-type recombinase/integrase n=1 Tax=Ornithinimicrobium panacihumi TaxID=2008449 RepID=UPI003F88A1DA
MTSTPPRSGGNTRGRRAGFGSVRRLPSGRIQARYTGPDGITHTAPTTFSTKGDAEAWLAIQRAAITLGKWRPASQDGQVSQTTFAEYAETWLRDRALKPRTRAHYRQLLDRQLLPRFGTLRPASITPEAVRDWHARTGTGTPTLRAHCYSLLRAILTTAVQDGLLPANPCHIRGAGNAKTVHKIRPASVAELEALVSAMPERYQVMTLLAAWCGLRFGELTELRHKDVDLSLGVLRVRRAVSRVDGEYVVGAPKSDAGVRDVAVPPHLIPALRNHLHSLAKGRDTLLFPAAGDSSRHLAPASLYRVFYRARAEAGRPDLRWHDLRHTGAVLAAQTGATLAELMGRLGHSTPQAALRYQHVAGGRDAEIAAALSRIASSDHSP